MNNTVLFFLLWRNCYLRAHIRNRLCQNLVINFYSLIELQENYQYLSLFTDKDKLENTIYICLNIKSLREYNQFCNCNYRDIVNDLVLDSGDIHHDKENQDLEEWDLDVIPIGITRLHCYFANNLKHRGILPQSITDLMVDNYIGNNSYNSGSKVLDSILSNLPSSLQKLSIPFQYNINATGVVLPNTLHDLDYTTNSISL